MKREKIIVGVGICIAFSIIINVLTNFESESEKIPAQSFANSILLNCKNEVYCAVNFLN